MVQSLDLSVSIEDAFKAHDVRLEGESIPRGHGRVHRRSVCGVLRLVGQTVIVGDHMRPILSRIHRGLRAAARGRIPRFWA